jgi:hypothetical protein
LDRLARRKQRPAHVLNGVPIESAEMAAHGRAGGSSYSALDNDQVLREDRSLRPRFR